MSDPMKDRHGADDRTTASAVRRDLGAKAHDIQDSVSSVKSAGDDVNRKAGALKDTAFAAATKVGRSARDSAEDLKSQAAPAVATFKDQAAQAAQEARSTVTALAEEARVRLNEIVDQQKNAGADQVAGVARAAQAAAGDLQQSSPQLARLIKSAAETVDHVAGDIRGSSMGDVVSSLSEFGRRQPVAFFGGAVVAGFLLARFLKSDAPASLGSASTGVRRP